MPTQLAKSNSPTAKTRAKREAKEMVSFLSTLTLTLILDNKKVENVTSSSVQDDKFYKEMAIIRYRSKNEIEANGAGENQKQTMAV